MDFRRLLHEERRRARAGAASKPEHDARITSSNQPLVDSAPLSIHDDHEMSSWRQRSPIDLLPYKVPGINTVYCIPEWITELEEEAILQRVNAVEPTGWVQLKHRRLQMFGGEVKQPFQTQPLPTWLAQIVDGLMESGLFQHDTRPNHALINEYGAGDCILPHQDGPSYLSLVAIVSTGADARFAFAPHRNHGETDSNLTPVSFPVGRRSLLVFTDAAYTKYLHTTDSVESGKRVSLTIRHVLQAPP